MLWCLRAAAVLAMLVFVPGLRDSFEPPKAAIVRVAGTALLVVGVAAIAGRGRDGRRRWTAVDVAVAGWLAAETLATLASRAPLLSLFGEPMQREGWLTSLGLAGLYAGARAAHAAHGEGSRAGGPALVTLAWMITAVAAASLYALVQAAGGDPIDWVGSAVYSPGGALARPAGTFGHPNLMGVAGAAAAAAALALAVAAPRGRVPFTLAATIATAATLVTLSRAAWLALLVAAPIALILAARARAGPPVPRSRWLAGAALALAVVIVLLAAGWGGRLAARFAELLSPAGGAGASRLEIWRSAWLAWQARPWLGHGPDTFALVFHRFQTPDYWRFEWAGLPYHAHSIALHTLATRGAVGLVAALAWLGCTAAAARAAWRATPGARPALAALLASLAAVAVAGLFGALGVAGALWLALGTAMIAALASHAPVAPVPCGAGRIVVLAAFALAVPLAVLGWLDLGASAAARSADLWMERSREGATADAADSGARARAREAAERATVLAPLEDAYHRLLADALLGTAAIAESVEPPLIAAEGAARRAVRRVPERAENHEQLARILAARVLATGATGPEPAAQTGVEAAIARVAELAPANALMIGECARLELLLGRPDRARDLAGRVAALYPDHAPALLVVAEAELARGDRAAATDALRRAFAGTWRGDSTAWLEARALAERLR